MFLKLNHTKLDVYTVARKLLIACYKVAKRFPSEERFNLSSQLQRAALSVMLNLAEGASRKTFRERRRFYEVSRGSAVEIDSAFDAAYDLGYAKMEELNEAGMLLIRVFQTLLKLMNPDDPAAK